MDRHTPEQRRANMQAIRSKDTKIELLLRKELWRRGLRYRKNCRDLPGTPDIVFGPAKVAVFCDSEFWHGFDWENRKDQIKSNRDFWITKIERNIQRDEEINKKLANLGYTVIRFWGKEININVIACADRVEYYLGKNNPSILVSPRQVNRVGCDDRLTPYAEWNRSKVNYCIYCGEPADTREHIPPKVFLDDVLPPDFSPTLPACADCNGGFSNGEEYVACTIDYLKSRTVAGYSMKKKTIARIKRNSVLAKTVKQQFQTEGDRDYIEIDNIEMFREIMTKLAKGHACYQLDSLWFSDEPAISFYFSFQLDDAAYHSFNAAPVMEIMPELGSRSCDEIVFINTDSGDIPCYSWNVIQEGRYRYLAYCDREGSVCVRIVIDEFFFCSVQFN